MTDSPRPIEILAISGSLRSRSSNTELLRAAAALAEDGIRVQFETELGSLPFFNPDLDAPGMVGPPVVESFRSRVATADGLLICSPEYAHGVPGVLKNALDWLVSFPAVVAKPIGLLNASPRSTHARESLAETLRTMATVIVPGASIAIPLNGRRLDAAAIVADRDLAALLRTALDALVAAGRSAGDPGHRGR